MAMRVKPETGEVSLKQRHRVTNWSEYDRALINRGNLTTWFDEASIQHSLTPPRPIGCGKPVWCSETAIQTCPTIKRFFQLPYRATEGLIKSLMRLCHLDLPVPDHTHMSRRAGELSVRIPRRPRHGPTPVVVDSTGLKIFGEGEWKVRQPGVGKRRTWRKIPLAVDETTKDIIGIEVATTARGDSGILPGLLDQIEDEIAQVSPDGAYDSHGCHAAITERSARAAIPPRDGAVTWGEDHARDVILQDIETTGLDGSKNDSGYHRYSSAENMLYRFKQLRDSLFSRRSERQENEVHARAAIINTFTYLGMPQSVRVGQVAPAA